MGIPQIASNVQPFPELPPWTAPRPLAGGARPTRATPPEPGSPWAGVPAAGTIDPAHLPVERIGRLWVPQSAVRGLYRSSWSPSPLVTARAAVQQGLRRMADLPQGLLTQHALLVAWGDFAQEIGLLPQLLGVAIPQKSVVHTPQAKVLSFLLGVLGGITYLQDLREGPHPLAHDWPALRAWGLVALADPSGISRTLAACDPPTVAALTAALHEVARPFIAQEVRLLGEQHQPLVIDLDLAPRRVSNTSTTFPGAEFGWQGNEVGLGYEAALAVLTSPTYGRLFLDGLHHPRHTVLLPRLQKLVRAVEERLDRRPQRRTALVQQRLAALQQDLARRLDWWDRQLAQQRGLQTRRDALPQEIGQWEAEVTALEATGRLERPHSRLAQARRHLTSARQQFQQLPQQLQRAAQAAATHQARVAALRAEYADLQAYLTQLQADNERNAAPVTIILRMDAGFGSGPNLTWLIEMGYLVYTKAYNAQVATGLLHQLPAGAHWTPVGRNAEMIGWGEHRLHDCPYPLTVGVERFHTPAEVKHSALLTYRDDGQELTLPAWFDFYNARQLIEAGIKEGNVVFQMHPLKMRSRGGIALQEQFCLFAANFVRWAAVWLRQRVAQGTPDFAEALTRVKALVRVGANTSAWVIGAAEHLLLKFDDTGAYPGVEIHLPGGWRSRPPLLPPAKVQNSDFRNDFGPGCT